MNNKTYGSTYNKMPQQSRPDDSDPAEFYRSDRIFTLQGLWYFRTQEGKDVGPFRYRDEAELMLSRFIQELMEHQLQATAGSKPHFRVSGILGRQQPG